ncbi:hypothetical protein GCM10028864_32940 [Microlunatus parietis]
MRARFYRLATTADPCKLGAALARPGATPRTRPRRPTDALLPREDVPPKHRVVLITRPAPALYSE